MQNDLSRILIVLLIGLVGCQQLGYADLAAGEDAVPLISDIDVDELTAYESSFHDVAFDYPQGWVVGEGKATIYFVSDNAHFPWGHEYSSSPKTYYYVKTRSPYLTRGDRRLRHARSAVELAQTTVDVFEMTLDDELAEPVKKLDVNGRDGASYLIDSGAYYHYAVLQRISADRVILVGARGHKKEIEEMKAIVHAVALTVRLPDGP